MNEHTVTMWLIRKSRLRNLKVKNVRDKRRIMILCFILQERIDILLCGGRLESKSIFSLNDPIWG